MVADNIRVMIMTTGFTSLFHERVSVKATGDYIVNTVMLRKFIKEQK